MMSTRVLIAPQRKGILQQNNNIENEKENQSLTLRKGVILINPKSDQIQDDEEGDWRPSSKKSPPNYVTSAESINLRRRQKPSANQQVIQSAHIIARRNERERNRVRQVNESFSVLRSRIPDYLYEPETDEKGKQARRKLSKVETLRLAVDYIQQLESLLNIKPDIYQDDSEEDGFFSSAENTQGSFFKAESDPEGDIMDLSQDCRSQESLDLKPQVSPEHVTYREEYFVVGELGKSGVEEPSSDLESSPLPPIETCGGDSPLPPISESFPSQLAYSDLYVPYESLIDLRAKTS